jgi:hypothetical protein
MMYVDSTFLLIIYILAASAAVISTYALWTLKELEEYYKNENSRKPNNAWDHYHDPRNQKKSKAKGH